MARVLSGLVVADRMGYNNYYQASSFPGRLPKRRRNWPVRTLECLPRQDGVVAPIYDGESACLTWANFVATSRP